MGGRKLASMVVVAVGLTLPAFAAPAFAADDVPARIDAARAAFQKGDLPRAARELDAALRQLHERLGHSLAETLPPPLIGWQADASEIQGLGQVGGGLSVTRAYSHNESSLNASLILDSPAVEAAAALLANPAATAAQPNMKRVRIGAEDALMRYDNSTKSGEITLVLGSRVLLEIEGENLANGDVLMDVAKGWNVAKIRALSGP